jgi:hypothetical protein
MLTYGFVGLWSVAVLNVLVGMGVCCMVVGHCGHSPLVTWSHVEHNHAGYGIIVALIHY